MSLVKHVHKRRQREYYEDEAKRLPHQELMYLRWDKHELWWHRKRLRFIFSFLSEVFAEKEVRTFADIGCAEGFYLRRIASFNRETFCVGTDIARTYIAKAKMNLKAPNVDFVVSDVENLPFKPNSIDVVLCSEVLEHVYNYHDCLSELGRVTQKTLLLSFPGHSYIYGVMSKIKPLGRLANSLLPKDVGHVSEVKLKSVLKTLKGDYVSLRAKIGGAFPTMVFKVIPSIRLVDVIDNLICGTLERFDATDHATMHVVEITMKEK